MIPKSREILAISWKTMHYYQVFFFFFFFFGGGGGGVGGGEAISPVTIFILFLQFTCLFYHSPMLNVEFEKLRMSCR